MTNEPRATRIPTLTTGEWSRRGAQALGSELIGQAYVTATVTVWD